MKVPIYDQTGKEIKEILLPKEIFGVKMNSDLVYQVVLSQTSNQRQISAHTKDRGDVRGGGKKPWKQKGTGRARHGSRRSPIWIGGGVTFGPTKEKNYDKKINKQMRRKALFMVLSSKAENNLVVVLEDLKSEGTKTKAMAQLLNKLPVKKESCLVALPTMDQKTILALRNLAKVQVVQAKDLNVLDILNTKYLLIPKESIKVIKDTFAKE
jgi:large subunit ribosomal protein L4